MSRCIYPFGFLLVIVLLASTVASPLAFAQEQTQANTIDVYRDDNGDGHPDDLVEAMRPIMMATDKDATDPTIRAHLQNLAERLPYSQRTRDLQAQTADVLEQLYAAESEVEAQAFISELRQLEAQMMTDPAYARTQEAMEALLDDPTVFQSDQVSAVGTIYLPLIALSGSSGDDDDNNNPPQPPALNLQRGDILLVDGSGSSSGIGWTDFLYQRIWGHAGIVDQINPVVIEQTLIYESNAGDLGVRPRSYVEEWVLEGNRLWHGRAANADLRDDVVVALDDAKDQYGTDGRTPYNIILTDKNTDEALYCSQLAWKIYGAAGMDIDSQDPAYAAWLTIRLGIALGPVTANLAIAPDEIAPDDDLVELDIVTIR